MQKKTQEVKGIFHEVGPHVRNSSKFTWRKLCHRNFIEICRFQSCVPKGTIGNFPVGFKSYGIPSFFFFVPKGG
jgi:hypothetical protein